jgi:hypothetical protein
VAFMTDRVGTADYELRWPPDVFADELRVLLATPQRSWDLRLPSLLREAFTSDVVASEIMGLQSSSWAEVDNPWEEPVTQRSALSELLSASSRLKQRTRPRPYYSNKTTAMTPPTADLETRLGRLYQSWTSLIAEYNARGYFGAAAPMPCVDDEYPPPNPSDVLEREVRERLGVQLTWPPSVDDLKALGADIFSGLVEVVHDLVARPRQIDRDHNWNNCGPHYSTYAHGPAQRLYRHDVNRLLTTADVGLTMAITGEDIGRLIRITDDARTDLVDRALQAADAPDEVAHAVALFRGRDANRAEKRSAVVALAAVLEARRKLLKDNLLSKDEGSLFMVANTFEIRHRNAAQQSDYDDVFLDWIFWWYLATVELTNQLVARQNSAGA